MIVNCYNITIKCIHRIEHLSLWKIANITRMKWENEKKKSSLNALCTIYVKKSRCEVILYCSWKDSFADCLVFTLWPLHRMLFFLSPLSFTHSISTFNFSWFNGKEAASIQLLPINNRLFSSFANSCLFLPLKNSERKWMKLAGWRIEYICV